MSLPPIRRQKLCLPLFIFPEVRQVLFRANSQVLFDLVVDLAESTDFPRIPQSSCSLLPWEWQRQQVEK